MKFKSVRARRSVAFLMALVMLLSMTVTTSAAGKSYNLYEFIAEKAYAGQTTEANILKSGALVSAGSISVEYPHNGLLSVTTDKLSANSFSSGISGKNWMPVTFTVNGESGSFNGTNSVSVPGSGSFDISVVYQLDTGISSTLLNLPAVLASEAASQMTVLNKLVAEDEPYMGYMEQLTKSQLDLFVGVLGIFVLNNDAKKDAALKSSFTEVINEMKANCFVDDETLTFYDLLWGYIFDGLAFYYEYSEDFHREISLFSRYLDRILGAETKNGVYLSEVDKENAIQKMIETAERYGFIDASTGFDFVDMRNKTNMAKSMLSAPNAAINRSSSKLPELAEILTDEATEVRDSSVVSVLSHYGNSLVLTSTVTATLTPGTSGDGTGGTDDGAVGGGGDIDGGGTGSGSGDGSGTGSGSDTGSGSSGGTGIGPVVGSIGGSIYLGFDSDIRRSFADAQKGDAVWFTTARTLVEDIHIHQPIYVMGVEKLKEDGFAFILRNEEASISADAPLTVVSALDGYVPVKSLSSNNYKLEKVENPAMGGKVAGSKVENVSENRYLLLDVDPNKGMKLNEFIKSFDLKQLAGYDLSFAIEGNDGTGLVCTDDRLVVTAKNSNGKVVATVSYVLVVMGDTNCNGKVNTSDAVVTQNIGMGATGSSTAVKMAANVNLNGTLDDPKINSSDVAYIMAKWFSWDLNTYVSNLK